MVVVNKLRNNFSSIERRNTHLLEWTLFFAGSEVVKGISDSTPDEICYSVDNREGSNRVKLIL